MVRCLGAVGLPSGAVMLRLVLLVAATVGAPTLLLCRRATKQAIP
jgi:hypothetical protein